MFWRQYKVMCTRLGVGGWVAVGATCDPGQYRIDHLVETNTHQPSHPPPTPPHHPRSQPQLRIRGKSIFSWIAISSMERNSKDYFLFCKTRNCFSLSLTKVLWETSNATRSDLFLLRRILVWHFSGGWIFFKLTRKPFQQKQIRIAVLKINLSHLSKSTIKT